MAEIYVKFKITNLPYLIICFCGAIFHLLLLSGFIKDPQKCFKNSKTYLVANLALADFFVCFSSFCYYILSLGWYEQVILEIRLPLPMGVSIMTLASISMDHYFMIAYPIRHRNYVTGKVILLLLVCIWLLAALYPAKLQIFTNQKYHRLVANISGVIITFVTATACTLTYKNSKKQSLDLRLQNCATAENRAQEIRTLQEKKFLNTVIIITSIVAICVWSASILRQVLALKDISVESLNPALKTLSLILISMYIS